MKNNRPRTRRNAASEAEEEDTDYIDTLRRATSRRQNRATSSHRRQSSEEPATATTQDETTTTTTAPSSSSNVALPHYHLRRRVPRMSSTTTGAAATSSSTDDYSSRRNSNRRTMQSSLRRLSSATTSVLGRRRRDEHDTDAATTSNNNWLDDEEDTDYVDTNHDNDVDDGDTNRATSTRRTRSSRRPNRSYASRISSPLSYAQRPDFNNNPFEHRGGSLINGYFDFLRRWDPMRILGANSINNTGRDGTASTQSEATLIEDDTFVDIMKPNGSSSSSSSSTNSQGINTQREGQLIEDDETIHHVYQLKASAKHMDTVKQKLTEQQDEHSSDCTICQESMDMDLDRYCSGVSNLVVLQCGHVFHASCLNDWINNNSSCPLCRLPIPFNIASFVDCFKFSSTIDCESDSEVLQISCNKSIFDREVSSAAQNNSTLYQSCLKVSQARLKNILVNMYTVLDIMNREFLHMKAQFNLSIRNFETENAIVTPVPEYSQALSAQIQEQLVGLNMTSEAQFQKMVYYSILKHNQMKLQSKFTEIETLFRNYVISHGLQVVSSEEKVKSLLYALIGTKLLTQLDDTTKQQSEPFFARLLSSTLPFS